MERLRQLSRVMTKANYRIVDLVKSIQSYRSDKDSKRLMDIGAIRISPSDIGSSAGIKEQYIPLGRNTIIRKLCQNDKQLALLGGDHHAAFDGFSRHLEACICNRNHFLVRQLQSGYEHMNPDVMDITATSASKDQIITRSRRQLLDQEFWLIQNMTRMLQLANFCELSRAQVEQLFFHEGGFNTLQISVSGSQYEVLKIWVLDKESCSATGAMRAFINELSGLSTRFNPFRFGDRYKRVVVATRLHNSDKMQLKMFKDLSQGELIHTIPEVAMKQSAIDKYIQMWTAGLFATGVGIHWLLPVSALDSGLLNSTHNLAISLAMVSAAVWLLHWNVILNKKTSYWKWRSELNYRSIIANNRGVISVLADRVQEEIFKESLLAYVHLLAHPEGISQPELESDVRQWAIANCDRAFKDVSAKLNIDLTEAISLLRQLNIVMLDQSNQLLTAKPFESSAAILSAEYNSSNLSVDLDGSTIIRNDDLNKLPDEPITEGYEKIRRTVNENK